MPISLDTATPNSYELEILTIVNNEGEGFDIRNIFLECNIYESIKRNFLLGEVIVADSVAFLENAKLFGQESIRVRFKQPQGLQDTDIHEDDLIDQVFRIYKIDAVTRLKDSTQVFKVSFCSPEMITSKRTRISAAFNGSMTGIAAKVAAEHLDIRDRGGDIKKSKSTLLPGWQVREESKGNQYHVVIPNWTVGYTINWLCKQSQGDTVNSGLQDSFYWYQTAVGDYRIQSLDSMMKIKYGGGRPFRYLGGSENDFKDEPYDMTDNNKTGMGRRILSYQVGTHADVLKGVIGGLFASKQTTINTTYKYFTEKSYNFIEKHFSGTGQSLNEYPFVRTDAETLFIGSSSEMGEDVSTKLRESTLTPKTIGSYSDAYQMLTSDSEFVNDDKNAFHQANHEIHLGSAQFRNAATKLLDYHTINVSLSARTDISVGTVINLEIPPVRPGDEEVEPKFNNGEHLITEIMWNLKPNALKTNLKCISDSVLNNIETTKIEYGESEKT